jgi:glycosyltransferase involved in cell wall biosynthesis
MRQILFLSYAFPPDNTPAAVRPSQLYDFLPEHGYQPLVVASSFEGARSESEFLHRVPRGNEKVASRASSRLAFWFMRYFAPYDDRLRWAPYASGDSMRIIRSHPIDAIYSTSPFLAAHFAALWLKARFGLPWIADFQDPVSDNPFRTRRWFYPYDAIVERCIFRHADRLVANTDTVAAAWAARYPQIASKMSILWNSFDPRETVPQPSPPRRSHRVLAHIGSLYGERHPAQILSAVERLGVLPDDIRIKLVGPIEAGILDRYKPLLDRMRASGMLEFDNRLVPREEALRETADADFLNERNASFQLPSKLLDYVRYGKPIVAYTPKDSPVERVLARSGIAYVAIDPLAPESTGDQKLRAFLQSGHEPQYATPWFEQTFSAETQAKVVSAMLNDLLNKATQAGR